jgi:hypothetical protein
MEWHLFLEVLVVPAIVGAYVYLRGGGIFKESHQGSSGILIGPPGSRLESLLQKADGSHSSNRQLAASANGKAVQPGQSYWLCTVRNAPCPPCSIIWRCLVAPKLTPTGIGAAYTMSTQLTGANGSRRSLPARLRN